MRLHWSKIRYYQKFLEQFQQKGSPYEKFSFFYQLRLDESLILSKEEKEKKNLLNMWEKTTLIFTWNNKPSTTTYTQLKAKMLSKHLVSAYQRKSVTAENSIIYASATFPDLAKCVLQTQFCQYTIDKCTSSQNIFVWMDFVFWGVILIWLDF